MGAEAVKGASGRLLPMLAAAGSGVLVGSAIVASRFALVEVGPVSLALLRYSIALGCMSIPLLSLRRSVAPLRIRARDLLPIGVLGILQFGVLIVLMNFGLRYIPSARAALIFSTMPLQALVLAAALGHERFTANKLLGVLLSMAGVGLALGGKALEAGSGSAWIGEAAVFASAGCGAVCSVLYRPYLQRYAALSVCVVATAASVLFLAPLALLEGVLGALPRLSTGAWWAVAFVGVNSGVGYFLWLWSLNRAGATRVTVFLALSPVTAAALGTLILGERTSSLFGIGVVLVAGGLWLAQRVPTTRAAEAEV